MKASLAHASLLSVGQLPRQHGEAETPTSNQSPRVTQGRRLLGLAALHTCPLPLPRSQVRARLGIEADLEISEARSEKGDLEQDEGKQ